MAIKNVLIVDDSATDSHLLGEMLKKNGYTVLTATSGEEGIHESTRGVVHSPSPRSTWCTHISARSLVVMLLPNHS